MKRLKLIYPIGLAALLLVAALSLLFLSGLGEKLALTLSALDLSALSPEEAAQAEAVATGEALGFLSLLPAILAVALAFITKEVIFSLFAGLVSGYMILNSLSVSGGYFSLISSVFSSTAGNILHTAGDPFHVTVIVLCLCIGGMVAVINASGGFAALGQKMTRNINTPKKATLMAQVLGLSLFFDDYANALITGPVMRSITDRQGVSREKLAYVVDSTAAPVAGIAIISSWIAAEVAAIESGFTIAGFEASAYSHFLGSIPFCFYNFAALLFVAAAAIMGREYGPMLAAERRARAGEPLKKGSASEAEENGTGAELKPGSLWSAILPIVTIIVYALIGFYTNGIQAAVEAGLLPAGTPFSFGNVSVAFGNADTVYVLMEAALLGSLVAIFMGCLTGRMNIVSGIGAWMQGMSGITLTAVILVLAWGLSSVLAELGAAYYLVDIVTLALPFWLLPMLIFIACCFISFAAGSFGCLVIVMPIAIPVAVSAVEAAGVNYSSAYLFSCIAAVMSGSIFGDHCSPVTDTTILSSLGAGCDNMDHVKTQLPYALTAAGVTSVFGYLPAGLGLPVWLSLGVSLALVVLVIRVFGKKIDDVPGLRS